MRKHNVQNAHTIPPTPAANHCDTFTKCVTIANNPDNNRPTTPQSPNNQRNVGGIATHQRHHRATTATPHGHPRPRPRPPAAGRHSPSPAAAVSRPDTALDAPHPPPGHGPTSGRVGAPRVEHIQTLIRTSCVEGGDGPKIRESCASRSPVEFFFANIRRMRLQSPAVASRCDSSQVVKRESPVEKFGVDFARDM